MWIIGFEYYVFDFNFFQYGLRIVFFELVGYFEVIMEVFLWFVLGLDFVIVYYFMELVFQSFDCEGDLVYFVFDEINFQFGELVQVIVDYLVVECGGVVDGIYGGDD